MCITSNAVTAADLRHLEDERQLVVALDFCHTLEAGSAIMQQHCHEKAVCPEGEIAHCDPRQQHYGLVKHLLPSLRKKMKIKCVDKCALCILET